MKPVMTMIKPVATILSLVWTLLSVCLGGAGFFYFVGADGSIDAGMAPVAGGAGILFLFGFIPLIRKLVRLGAVAQPLARPARPDRQADHWEEPESSFDPDAADAAIARYLAQRSPETLRRDPTPENAPLAGRKAFGKKRG